LGKRRKIQIVMAFILLLKTHYYFSMPEKERHIKEIEILRREREQKTKNTEN